MSRPRDPDDRALETLVASVVVVCFLVFIAALAYAIVQTYAP